MNITSKMTVYTVFVLAMVFSLLLMMNYFKFQNILSNVTSSRLAVVNQTLEDSISNAVNLGLALDEIQIAQSIIDRAKKSDKAIQSIDVFDANGQVLFSTRDGGNKSKIASDILDKLIKVKPANSVTNEWNNTTGEAFVVGVTLYNSFDRAIGGIVLNYDKSQYNGQVAAMLKELATATGLVLLGAAILAFIGIGFGFRELSRSYAAMEAALANVRDGKTSTAAEPDTGSFDYKLQTIAGNVDEAYSLIDQSGASASKSTK